MSRFSRIALAFAAALAVSGPARALDDFGLGRAATSAEIDAWNIDVRPDFAGLPKGSGSVDQGQTIWEGKCAACHGTFGESNKVFTPLIGGVVKEDLATGHVAALKRTDFPARTTFMKVATISTLFDYIRRAMPWNAPKTLTNDQVYAVLAYLLNLAEIVPDDFVLNEQTMRDVQKIMPNRNGMTWQHAMWPGAELSGKTIRPDTAATACMKDCKKEVVVSSALPDYALSSHGNIADQNRQFGPVRGLVTGPSTLGHAARKPMTEVAEGAGCLQCHMVDSRLIGPAYAEVAQKYKGQNMADKLIEKIRTGGGGVWGDVEMPAQAEVKDEDLKNLVAWILSGASTKQ
jgi:S-disulfanyl-L-cysteine oxidoreductase SoxD